MENTVYRSWFCARALGNGDGTFQTAVTYGVDGSCPYSVAVADVNGDGKPDLVISGGGVWVLPGNGDGIITFKQRSTIGGRVGGGSRRERGRQTRRIWLVLLSTAAEGPTLTTSTLAVGTHSLTATYNGDSNFATSTSPPLQQLVEGAIAALSSTSLNFGSQTVGMPSSQQTLTVTNTGNIVLTVSIAITGTDASLSNVTE